MKIDTSRFGEIEIAKEKILNFERGLPGFPGCHRFTLITSEETEPFLWLQSIDEPEISLPVINPIRLFPDYSPIVNEADFGHLENPPDEDVLVLTVAVIPPEYEKMTTNLLSPILINLKNNKALQTIMEQSDYQIKQPIFDKILENLDAEPSEGGGVFAGSDAQNQPINLA